MDAASVGWGLPCVAVLQDRAARGFFYLILVYSMLQLMSINKYKS